jgi:hypothetical protein
VPVPSISLFPTRAPLLSQVGQEKALSPTPYDYFIMLLIIKKKIKAEEIKAILDCLHSMKRTERN